MTIKTLVDDYCAKRSLVGKHGLALLRNAALLGVDLGGLAVVAGCAHGGFAALAAESGDRASWLPSGARATV